MRALYLLPVLALAGCTVGPDYHRPTTVGQDAGWIAAGKSGPVDGAPWAALNDPMLATLIDQALVANADIAEADAKLREARAERGATAAQGLPQAEATASGQQQQVSVNGQFPARNIPHFDRNYSLFDLGFDASWEIDLWGRNRRAVEAAGRQVDAAAARAADTRLRVAAEVARTYADLRGTQAALAAARGDADAQAQIATLVHQRFVAGEASRLDDNRAAAQARTTAASIPLLAAQARADAYGLATLTGQPPEALVSLVEAAAPLPVPPRDIALGLRSEMLRRRPDVRAAEADLAAATANVGVATADLFPRLSLVGGIGQQARKPGDLALGSSTFFQVGPSLSWPIFDAGRIRANIRAADARTDQAAARYTKAVLTALADSETAINRYQSALAAVDERAAAHANSAAALDLARQRYKAGEDDLPTLLDAQSSDAHADQAEANARADALTSYAALVKAIGGGVAAAQR